MLKFFRRIRRKLIDEGNLKRYLIYAVGEIVLVVLGILIALSINNWNENQKNRKQELNYIVEINNEFKDNKSELIKLKAKHEKILNKCEAIIELFPISTEESVLDTLSKHLEGTWNYYIYTPKQNAINNLVSQPSFQKMRNKELKKILDLWKVVLNNYQITEIEAKDFVFNYYDPYFRDNFDYYDMSHPRTNLELLQSFKYINLIKEREWIQNNILTGDDNLENLETTIDKIIELTEKEIN